MTDFLPDGCSAPKPNDGPRMLPWTEHSSDCNPAQMRANGSWDDKSMCQDMGTMRSVDEKSVLDAAQRRQSETLPGGRYPMPDANHARAALARLNQGNLSESQKEKVRARANRILGKNKKK